MTDITSPVSRDRTSRTHLLVGLVAALMALGLLWSPLSAYFSERSALLLTQAQLHSAKTLNSTLSAEIKSLNDLREVAYLAKTELNMVYPGQKSYLVTSSG